MCGLFGIAGPGISLTDLHVFKALMVFSSLRGVDSTGVFKCGYRGSKPKLLKECIPSPVFAIENREFFHDTMVYTLMGHVRDTTVGKINDENAHPFEFSNIVGAHNGTLVDNKYLKDKTRSDSSLMFEDINKRGIKKVLEGISVMSALAISVFDKKSNVLTFARNSRRPLHVATHPTRGVIYWASEGSMLNLCLERGGISADIQTFESGRIYSTDVQDIKGCKTGHTWDVEDFKQKSQTITPKSQSTTDIKCEQTQTHKPSDMTCCYCDQPISPRDFLTNDYGYFKYKDGKTGKDDEYFYHLRCVTT